MKKLALLATLLGLLATVDVANAVVAAPVNIAYPLHNSNVTNPFYSSFTVNCPLSTTPQTTSWFIDGVLVGKAPFYHTAGIHFAYRLSPNVTHSLRVTTSCGGVETVQFRVI